MEVSRQLQAPVALLPEKYAQIPIEYEAGWVPEPVWTRCWRERHLCPCRESYTGRPTHSPVTVRTGRPTLVS